MSDESIPLTVTEWEEWGNPRDNADDYQYMKSYSPYDNVDEVDYPAMYVEAGLNDPACSTGSPPSGSPSCASPRPTTALSY